MAWAYIEYLKRKRESNKSHDAGIGDGGDKAVSQEKKGPPFFARKRPGGFIPRISETMLDAINRFSRLKRAVR